jgi:hypothetical protein
MRAVRIRITIYREFEAAMPPHPNDITDDGEEHSKPRNALMVSSDGFPGTLFPFSTNNLNWAI